MILGARTSSHWTLLGADIHRLSRVGVGIDTPTAQHHVVSADPARVGSIVRGAVGQSASLQEWHDGAGAVVASMSPAGNVTLAAAAVAGWSDARVARVGAAALKVTDGSSGFGSMQSSKWIGPNGTVITDTGDGRLVITKANGTRPDVVQLGPSDSNGLTINTVTAGVFAFSNALGGWCDFSGTIGSYSFGAGFTLQAYGSEYIGIQNNRVSPTKGVRASIATDGEMEILTRSGANTAVLKANKLKQSAAEGQSTTIQSASALLSGLTGPTATATNLIPAGALVLGVTARVTTAVTGATSIQVGDGTDVDRWAAALGVALGSTSDGSSATIATPPLYPATTSVVLTAVGGNFTAGVVRLTVHYTLVGAPTS